MYLAKKLKDFDEKDRLQEGGVITDKLREKGDRLESRMTKVRSAGILFLTIAYSPFIKLSFQILQCVETMPGKYYLRDNTAVSCDTGLHAFFVFLAIVSLIFIGLGLPSN